MTKTRWIVVIVLLVAVLGTNAQAQAPAPATPVSPPAVTRPVDQTDLRQQIYVMEGALMRAVSSGALQLNREIRSIMPEMMVLSGEPQARGLYLEGYGVFFDVGVPVLHQSLVWSLRAMLEQDTKGLADALDVVKEFAKRETGPRRTAVDNAIARLELQLGPITKSNERQRRSSLAAPLDRQVTGATLAAEPPASPPVTASPLPEIGRLYLQDPNAINKAYTDAVQGALVDAMIDYSVMPIRADEWVTVAARDNMQRDSLAPSDPHEEVVWVVLRIKGSDLVAYRSGGIDRNEARKRVQVRQF